MQWHGHAELSSDASFLVRPARNARTACSVASSSSSPARAIAWSRLIGPGQIEK